MKSLVTGGAGFIGSTLVDALSGAGHSVSVIDDESSESHEQFYKNKDATYYKVSICDYKKLADVFSKENPELVFHLAAESRIQSTIDDPRKACEVNFLGTCNVLQAAYRFDCERLMYSSTSSAYGLKNPIPQTEYMDRDCLNPYSVTKVAAEDLCKMYTSLYDLETIIFRYFNVYGPREPVRGQYAPVVGRFLKQKESGKALTIVGDGKQTRDYTHVDDVVEANILASATQNKEALGEVFNIGSGKRYSVLDVARLVGGNKMDFLPSRSGEARDTLADIKKAKKLLGWKPQKDLKQYLTI